MPGKPASAIPVGTQFSPDLINLGAFLQAIIAHSGDKEAMMVATWDKSVRKQQPTKDPTRRQRSLPLEAAVQYGLLTPKSYEATDEARRLAPCAPAELAAAFARHILLNLGGLRVLTGIEQMDADRITVTGDTLARFLTEQGFAVTEHNTAINSLRMWLAEAGLFPKGRGKDSWRIEQAVKEQLVGLPEDTVGVLSSLSSKQIAFVHALCRVQPEGWCKASDIRELAETSSEYRFNRGSLPNDVLKTLQDAGLITYRTGGTSEGKTSELRLTELFNAEVLEPFISETIKTLDPATSSYYRKRPEDIFTDLDSSDKHKKGQALEAFAVYLMRLLGLRFVEWRKRAASTGGSEVDALLMGMMGALPTRWQVQCKNTTSNVDLEDVAKEIGLLPLTNATHVILFTTSSFTSAAWGFAEAIMAKSAVTVFLLDKRDLKRVRDSAASLGAILKEQGQRVLARRPAHTVWSD